MHAKLNSNNMLSKNRKGITITEVVIASALLIAAIVPMLTGLTRSHNVTAKIEQKTKSLALAQTKIAEIRARSINNYDSSYSANNTTLESNYYCDVDDSTVSSDLRQITVSVGYDDDNGSDLDTDEVDVKLVTLIARRD